MRQQLLLFLASVVLALAAIPVALLVTSAGGWVFGVAALPVSVAIGFAVLARGLYDLRTAADRTLVWVTLSAVLAALYAVVIIGITRGANVAGATWPTWLAAALIAVSFAPLRDALQRGINRLTFGRWDEPYDVLAALGQRLEATASVDGLLADVVSELGELGLSQVTVLDAAGEVLASVDRAGSADAEKDGTAEASRAASGNGARAGDGEELALAAFGKRVGTLRFRTATPLRASERRLLDDLAGHLGGVVHARALTIDLQRALERQVLAREEERRRLRRDLHDGLGPALAGHLLRLDVVAVQVDPGSVARAAIDELRLELGATVAEVRRVVEGLRPPALDELGLAPALGQVLQRLTAASSVALELEVAPLPPLTAATEVAAYRIATEAVTNVVRHSGASACTVRLAAADGWLRLEVSDNGRGLTGGGAGHGLQTMRERARELRGELTVASAGVGAEAAEVGIGAGTGTGPGNGTGRGAGSVSGPGTGTTVVALLPLLTPGFEQTPPVPTPRLAPVTS